MYKNWIEIRRNIERTARFGIGTKIDNLFMDVLELLRKSVYTPVDKKIILLEEVADKIDSSRFFLQTLWEAKLITNEKYVCLETEIENLGRMIGGWKKGLISKTSATKAEERKQ